jgi:ankyrin repeat protein
MNFNTLCDELDITSDKSDSEKLVLLKQWFHENISRDIQFEGNEQEQFELYYESAEFYLEDFLPETLHDMHQQNPKLDGESVISAAVIRGYDRFIMSLKVDKSLLNTPNSKGMTPLHSAAIEGHFYTTQALLTLGVNTDVLNNQKQFPLFSALFLPVLHNEALKHNKINIFKLLQDKDSRNLKQQDDSGNTVLHQMAVHDFGTLIQETLAAHIELAYIQNNHTHYPIHTAILNNQMHNIHPLLHVKDAQTLADSNGWVALHYAARYSTKDILKLCCEVTDNIDIRDKMGRSPLMLAVELGRISTVEDLMEQGAQIDLIDSTGFTVLHHAVNSDNLEMVRWLLDNPLIDINTQDAYKRTPLDLSKLNEINNLLLERGACPRDKPQSPTENYSGN